MSHRNNQLAAQLASLNDLTLAQLRERWAEALGAPPPKYVRQDYLIRALAHRLQEQTCGGLPLSILRRLTKLVGEAAPNANRTPAPRSDLKPGSRLMREWQGTTHEVSVVDGGYVYRAKTYKSLSEIARLITGTRWSGPLFFGLKSMRKGAEAGGQDRTFVVDLTSKPSSVRKGGGREASGSGSRP